MIDVMNVVRHDALHLLNRMGGLPNQRFFTPIDEFWRVLAKVVPTDVALVDAGCGRGDLIGEAEGRGVAIAGIDILTREGQDERVTLKDAVSFPWGAKSWLMMCRPSHDGWVWDAARNARRLGAHVLYVGLPRNYKTDLGCVKSECLGRVGMEGEKLYLIKPYVQKGGE